MVVSEFVLVWIVAVVAVLGMNSEQNRPENVTSINSFISASEPAKFTNQVTSKSSTKFENQTTRKPLIFANAVTHEKDGSIHIKLLCVYGRDTRITDVSPNAIVIEVASSVEERNVALRYYMAAVLDYWQPIEIIKDEKNIAKTLKLKPGEGATSVEEVERRIQAAYYYAEDRANTPHPGESLEKDESD